MMLRRKCGVSPNLKVGGLISVPSSNVSLGKILNLDLTLMDEYRAWVGNKQGSSGVHSPDKNFRKFK